MPSWIHKKGKADTIHSPESGTPVYLHVYTMLPPSAIAFITTALGIGVYHSGVEIRGREYCFGAHPHELPGIFVVTPKVGPPGVTYRKSIFMGYCKYSDNHINRIIHTISREYTGVSYRLLTRNCNHFSSDLCRRLLGKPIPNWINRAAAIASCFPCILPPEWIRPPECEPEIPITDHTDISHAPQKKKNEFLRKR
ncbi:uncharacterized protein VTP21DRAFT_8625 [Calcarisporiella thermophila]|uniref:uncharacterized protein n=1 Tax=Calcarisporiella thermophila TaxID=911321 RepID=UPI003741FC9F